MENAGCPTSGQLADLRKSSRSRYHLAVGQIKQNSGAIIKDKAVNRLLGKYFKDFWNSLKK